MSRSGGNRLLAAAACGAALLMLSGCGQLSQVLGGAGSADAPIRDAQTEEIVESSDADVFTLKVGDCFNDEATTSTEVSSVPTVPCSEAHDNELYFEFELPAGDYPGQTEVDAEADQRCLNEFASFIGTAYEASALDFWYLTPTQAGWEQIDDRVVQCAVWDPSAQTVGSLGGSGR